MKLKSLFILLLLLAAGGSAFAQGFRFDSTVTSQGTIATVTNAVVIPANPQIAFCNFPANAVPCTNKATTYTSQTLVTPCSTSTQIVLVGTSSCVASPDAQDNWGVWVPAGMYAYTITLSGGVNLGPYVVTLFPTNGNYTMATLTVSGTTTHNGTTNLNGQTNAGNVNFCGPEPWTDVTKLSVCFGLSNLVGDGVTDNVAAFNALLTLAANPANNIHVIYFPITSTGKYRFASKPNAVGIEAVLKCAQSPVQWNPTGVDAAQLLADYTEATATNGFIDFSGSTSPGNSGIVGCQIWKGAGQTGGTAIKYDGTSTSQRAGGGPIEDTRVSGDGTWNWTLRVDCTNITTSGSQGCRDIALRNFDGFQATTGCMSLNNAVHFDWVHGGCFPTGGGNAHVDVTGTSTANANSTNVGFTDVHILDTLALDWVKNFVCAGCYTNSLTATVNTVQSTFFGVSNNAPSISGQLAYASFDPVSPAGYGTMLTDSIRAANFLSSGTAPGNIAVGDISASNGTTSGNMKIGSDGNMIARRNNGSGAGTNLALTFDAFATTPFQFDTTNGFLTTRHIKTSGAVFGNTGTFNQGYDSTTGTGTYNANNNGSSSFSGAWNCTNVTPVTVNNNSASDQNLMACTIPAGTLNRVGRTLRVKVKGVYSTPAASTSQMTIKLKLCTVSGCGSGTVITPINIQSTALGTVQITNDNFSLRSEITTQTAGASSAYEASGEFLIDLSTLTTAADSEFGDTNVATVGTIDSTAQLFLQTTIAFSNASASNSATQRQLIAETIN